MSLDTDQPIADRLAQLETTIEALRAENDQLHDRIETLGTEVADLRDERDHLTERVDTLQRETAKLRGRIDDYTGLEDRVTVLETRPHIEWDTKDFDDAVVTRPDRLITRSERHSRTGPSATRSSVISTRSLAGSALARLTPTGHATERRRRDTTGGTVHLS